MITDILFDLGGVLIDLDTEGMQKACIRHGIGMETFFVPATADSTSSVCQGIAASDLITDYQVGLISTDALIARISNLCPGKTTEQIIEAWNACLGDIPTERLDVIKELRARGYRTHLLSNTNDLHWRHVRDTYFCQPGYTPEELFDNLFLSHEMHASKPMPEIYEQVIAGIRRRHGQNIPAENMLFFDDAQANTQAAIAAGMRAEWLDLNRETIIELVAKTVQ